MDLPEKQIMRELEKALHEIERLRQENAKLRKKLGMEFSEPKVDTIDQGQVLPCPAAELKKLRKPPPLCG